MPLVPVGCTHSKEKQAELFLVAAFCLLRNSFVGHLAEALEGWVRLRLDGQI